MTTLETAHAAVLSLAGDFARHEHAHLAADYSEARVRQDFIDKFLIALGWDVLHNQQKNPFEQEVRVENRVILEHTQRRADYAFFVSPNFRDVRFFVEAKKPSRQLGTADSYFQTIRYGWNSTTPVALLTDFREFHVLDCRYRPDIDTAPERVIFTLGCQELSDQEKFAKLYYLFSREAVADNALEKFAEALPKKRGKATQRGLFKGGFQSIDDSFLSELDGFRDTLAREFKNRNPDLDGDTLTEITQRTLDRLVFLRFLEDKLIETRESVANFGSHGSVWGDFVAACRRLDSVYNGIVFKKHALLDSPSFKVDDEVFGDICEDLSDKNSPYNFDVIPIHILGSIYERFLGNIIVATEKRARLEQKPEVRKAGGVYYTPEEIVRYIVEHTVGVAVASKNPNQIADMKFADIACGSGSFLLGVYDYLLTYHRTWYNANRSRAKDGDIVVLPDGTVRLSLAKRREILLNNIYGVDIDHQAVEVAQLSLYLKLLEDESTASAKHYQMEIHQAILPSLSQNIKCGNSLIGSEIYEGSLFGAEEHRAVNPLDFRDAFPDIMKRGGFDVLVGNPPYVNAWDFFENQPKVRDYLTNSGRYTTADRHWDLYVLFLERAHQLVRSGGRYGFIIPYSFALQKYGMLGRQLMLNKATIESVADIRTVMVFRDVPVITMIPIVLNREPGQRDEIIIRKPIPDTTRKRVLRFEDSHQTARNVFLKQHETMLRLDLSKPALRLLERMRKNSVTIGDLCYVNYGAQMSSKVKGGFGKGHVIRESKESAACRPMIGGRELFRYSIRWEGRYVDYSYADKMYGPRWPEFFEQSKLMIRDITGTHRIESTLDEDGFYCDHTILCAQRHCDVAKWKATSAEVRARSAKYPLEFLAAVVGCTAVSAYFYLMLSGEGVRTGGGFHTYPETIRAFPVPNVELLKKNDLESVEKIGQLARDAIDCRSKLAQTKTDRDREYFEQRFASIDRQIDTMVSGLFGLDEKDILVATDAADA